MEEETKNLWNKKADELTVGDILKINASVPIFMIGCGIAAVAVVVVSDKITTKFRTIRMNRNLSKIEIVED